MRFTQFERSSLLYRGGWNPAQVAFVVSILVTIISILFGTRQGSRVVGALPLLASCRSPISLPHPFMGGVFAWGGRLAFQRDVAFGLNLSPGQSENNHIPNLFNEGGCWDNQLLARKFPVVTDTFGTGTTNLSCSEGLTPCGQLALRVRVRHTVGAPNGKPGIPIRLSDLLGRFDQTCLGGISPALRLAPPPMWGGIPWIHSLLSSSGLASRWGWELSSLLAGYKPRQTQNLPASLEILGGPLSLLRQCSRGSVQPPKGQDRNKSLSSTPEGIMHNGTTVLKGCGGFIEPPFMTFEVIIFECITSNSLLRTSRVPWGFKPWESIWYIPKVWSQKKSVWDPKGPQLGRSSYFGVNLVAAYLWLVSPTGWHDGFPTGGRDAIMAMPKALPQSPVVIVFVD